MQEAVVSHETGTAVVTLKADVDDSVLKKTGYTSGMKHSAGLRRDSNLVSSYEELEKLLDFDLANR